MILDFIAFQVSPMLTMLTRDCETGPILRQGVFMRKEFIDKTNAQSKKNKPRKKPTDDVDASTNSFANPLYQSEDSGDNFLEMYPSSRHMETLDRKATRGRGRAQQGF